MTHAFCPGYPPPYDTLVKDYPGAAVYPAADFRVEWGPIFHRGRLDGTARVLVIGQDPATEEGYVRRILVGDAGQLTQGLLARIGITHSYVAINTFLYSVAPKTSGSKYRNDANIAAYRNRWLNLLAEHNQFEAVITLGGLANAAYTAWHKTPKGKTCTAFPAGVTHPTAPSHSADKVQGTKDLLDNWNAALPGLRNAIKHPDKTTALKKYGTKIVASDHTPIPEADLPPGLPAWTRSTEPWSQRGGATDPDARATLVITVPADQRTWKQA